MITVSNLDLIFPDKKIFEDVNIKFLPGNCYGVIGANGAGKSTFLKVLSGEKDSTSGNVFIEKGNRMAVLKQDHFEYDEYSVIETVIMGHKQLFDIMMAKEVLYAKDPFTDDDGIELAELEVEFAELNGWNAEFDSEKLLNGLGVPQNIFGKKMSEVLGKDKVKVLLAQALFGNPDILLLDEPTNHLDFKAIMWLENFLLNYDKTVITVSHDRHFLNKVCTHTVDIDYAKVKLYPGNYDFWRESSQLAQRLMMDSNKKKEEKIKALKDFIARFSANASKSSQATSRKKSLEKINLDEIVPSSRRYPYIGFDIARNLGKDVLYVDDLSVSFKGEKVFENVSFVVNRDDKVAITGKNDLAKTMLLKVLAGDVEPDSGTIKWGQTVEKANLPADNNEFFMDNNNNLVEWLRQYSKEPAESYLRGFLGRMLFSGDEPMKKVKVLSGGEKMRCMFSRLMLSEANTLLIDQPTNHLDLEAIQSVNTGLKEYKGSLLLASHDHSLLATVANKVVEIGKTGSYTYEGDFDNFLSNEVTRERIKALY
ncbi:putative ABC transporter ATP-binding protein YheS [Candidatus Izimaplasma bacterium HR1]|jgi:ATPase subunit of ABC transporter with duplicated ATPase domains|uniref:ABC-F family ATP-binding cassette domain-containing protein n=1 Tax=Candidatus Izimoplasma sp. HR1 TaxID=1541959 RepID=UPI0004F70430|nr:putative ABC transporter ATP-binding protein YheS [Candidatus Izimaplasma bacterium HR1]